MALLRPRSRQVDGKPVQGESLPIYIHNRDYYLTELTVYADGMVDCWELVTFKEFVHKVQSGWVVTALPEGAAVSVSPLGRFKATQVRNGVKEDEFIRQVRDLIEELNDRPTSRHRCRDAFKAFQETPDDEHREMLRRAYEAVPEHERIFLGDMDTKDIPIRMAIYGREETARSLGMTSLPDESPSVQPSKKRVLVPSITFALSLYRGNGLEDALFPRDRMSEVEELLRSENTETVKAGLATLVQDALELLDKHSRRPAVQRRAAAALANVGEFLASQRQTATAADLLIRSIRADPDGKAPIELARLALNQKDRALAQQFVKLMREFDMEPLSAPRRSHARAFQLDVSAFEELCKES